MDKQAQHMANQEKQIQNLERREKEYLQHVKMIEKQLAQVATERGASSNEPLPAQPYPNPSSGHHSVNAVTLRSGASYKGPSMEKGEGEEVEKEEERKREKENESSKPEKNRGKEKKSEEGEVEKTENRGKEVKKPPTDPKFEPPPPYPHRLVERKLGDKFNKFLEMMKGLQVNMPFLQAISQMPAYAKFLKDLLSNKSRLEEAETITLPHQVSALVQREMPRKFNDPGSFTLPVRIGDLDPLGALADLGAGVSLMPLSIAKKLAFELVPTRKTIQLADRSIRVPDGQLIDIPIRVGHLVVPCDFIVMDIEADPVTPLILGREALKTLGAVVNCKNNTITVEVATEKVTFEFSKIMKQPMVAREQICQLSLKEQGIEDVEQELEAEVSLIGQDVDKYNKISEGEKLDFQKHL